MTPLKDQTIFVTGASRGAGKGITQVLLDAGADVIMGCSRRTDALDKFAWEHRQQVVGIVEADFAIPGKAEEAWAMAKDANLGIDGLVLNHGIFEGASVHDAADAWRDNWARTLQVNLQSAADLARCALRDWMDGDDKGEAHGGTLIAIASRAAHRGDDFEHPAYAASKAGMIAMIKTFARAYSGKGLLAYAISPGWIDTEMAPQDPEDRAKALAEVPYGEMATPEELGRLCAFLLDGGAPSATGATFDVNGASYVR